MSRKTGAESGTIVTFLAYSLSQLRFRGHVRFCRQAKMSSTFHRLARAAAIATMLTLAPQAWSSKVWAQSGDPDAEMRVQQLENQLRQLTGQNEELHSPTRQPEGRLRMLRGGAQAAPGGPPAVAQPNIAAAPPVQLNAPMRQGGPEAPHGPPPPRGGFRGAPAPP